MRTYHRLLPTMSLLLIALILASCGSSDEPGAVPGAIASSQDSLTVDLTGVDSTTVFDLLRQHHDVEYRSTVTGTFVTSIDKVTVGQGYFWVYSVNDTMATTACDKFMTSSGDRVQWHFRSMAR